MKNKILILGIIFAVSTAVSFGQSCSDYILKFGNEKNSVYTKDIQSKSGLFKKGQPQKLNIIFSEGKDYLVKFYNSVPTNKVSYNMTTSSGDKIFDYDNVQIYKDLTVKEKAMNEKKVQRKEMEKNDEEVDSLFKKEEYKLAKAAGDARAIILKDRNTVPSVEFSTTSGVSCVIEVTLVETEPSTPTSCIGVLILSKNAEGVGFQDDSYTKAKKAGDAKAKADADKLKAEADKAKADADAAKAKAEADKKKKKR